MPPKVNADSVKNAQSHEKSRITVSDWRLITIAAFIVLAALWPLYLILKFGENFPFRDEWSLAPLLIHARQNTLTFNDFWTPTNEHRIVLQKVFALALAPFTQWNIRAEMILAWVFICMLSPLLAMLCKTTHDDAAGVAIPQTPRAMTEKVPHWMWHWLFANALIFSPVQQENLLGGFNFVNFMPSVFLAAACVILQLRGVKWTTLIASAVLVECASLSIANGLLGWFVLLPLITHSDSREALRGKIIYVACWLVLTTISFVTYFWDYAGYSLSTHYYNSSIGTQIQYFFAFLGAPLALGFNASIEVATVSGVLLVLLYLGCAWYFVGRYIRGDFSSAHRMLPWIALGGYPLACALLGARGRAGLGLAQALSSRYTTITLILLIALANLLDIIRRQKQIERGTAPAGMRVTQFGFLFAVIVGLSFSCVESLNLAKITRRQRRSGRAHLTFLSIVREPMADLFVSGLTDLRTLAQDVDAMGYIHPPMVKDPDVRKLLASGADAPSERVLAGAVERGQKTPDQIMQIMGWAALPRQNRPADAVLVSYRNDKGEEVLCAVVDISLLRPDVAQAHGPKMLETGWLASFPADRIPDGPHSVTCWAYDAQDRRAYPLALQQGSNR